MTYWSHQAVSYLNLYTVSVVCVPFSSFSTVAWDTALMIGHQTEDIYWACNICLVLWKTQVDKYGVSSWKYTCNIHIHIHMYLYVSMNVYIFFLRLVFSLSLFNYISACKMTTLHLSLSLMPSVLKINAGSFPRRAVLNLSWKQLE